MYTVRTLRPIAIQRLVCSNALLPPHRDIHSTHIALLTPHTVRRHPQYTERASNTTHIHASPHIIITITLLKITRRYPQYAQHTANTTYIHITHYALLTPRTCTTTHFYNGRIARTLGATICPTCFCEKDDRKANAQ